MPRCPNGSRRNKQSGLCEPKMKNKTKQCPADKLLNPKTKRCIKNTTANRNKLKNKTKQCPSGKLLNPKTNRCIKNTTANRNKLKLTVKPNKHYIVYKKCNRGNQLVELNNVNYRIDDKQSTDEFKNYQFSYQNKPLSNIKFISKGGYGSVYRLSDSSNTYQIALKTYLNKKDGELSMLRLLKKKKIPCEIVNSRLLKLKKGHVTIMDSMNGSLKNIKPSIDQVLNIWKQIITHLDCLNKHKLSYTDLKTDNVLYKCTDKHKMIVVLGDVGGICPQTSNRQNASTFCPWEWRYTRGFPMCNQSTMVWCSAILLFELLQIPVDEFYYNQIYKLNMYKLKDIIKHKCMNKKILKLKNKVPVSTLLVSMLELDPKNRPTLLQVLNMID